jgi:uncharacterized protein (DUF952 family)
MTRTIYKIVTENEWREARRLMRFEGSSVDRRDGFVHFSTAAQVAETARRHFAGVSDLILLAVDATMLGEDLRDEPSRGGDLFPHLYAPLPVAAVRWARPLPWDGERHLFPELDP